MAVKLTFSIVLIEHSHKFNNRLGGKIQALFQMPIEIFSKPRVQLSYVRTDLFALPFGIHHERGRITRAIIRARNIIG